MSDQNEISLSVEETNQLRAKLGLKPLQVDNDNDDGEVKPGHASMATDILVAPVVPGENQRIDSVREKLAAVKEKREMAKKLATVKTIGSNAEVDDTMSWIKRSREIEKQKQEAAAAKKAKELDELDQMSQTKPTYTANDLKGLQVAHDADDLTEGQTTILTLKDSRVLDDSEGDILMNVNMADDERTKKNVENRKGKSKYTGLEDEDEFDVPGQPKRKKLLDKYDDIDVITGDKKKQDKAKLILGGSGMASSDVKQEDGSADAPRSLVSLAMGDLPVASDYYTADEMAQFKKKKRVGKGRKRDVLTADDLEPLDEPAPVKKTETAPKMDLNIDPDEMQTDNVDKLLEGPLEVDEAERQAELELQAALERARRVKAPATAGNGSNRERLAAVRAAAILEDEDKPAPAKGADGEVVFSQMGEFVRSVGGADASSARPSKSGVKEEEVSTKPGGFKSTRDSHMDEDSDGAEGHVKKEEGEEEEEEEE
eukprot:m.80579 g.80579  ORF g.80579 m.80579 type:complete len:485 (+) comp14847_c0_seq1:84-1538(+)